MPKLPSLKPSKLEKILKKEGFVLDRIKGSHHIYFHPTTKRIVVIPFHKNELPKGTFLSILKQANISREKLDEYLK